MLNVHQNSSTATEKHVHELMSFDQPESKILSWKRLVVVEVRKQKLMQTMEAYVGGLM